MKEQLRIIIFAPLLVGLLVTNHFAMGQSEAAKEGFSLAELELLPGDDLDIWYSINHMQRNIDLSLNYLEDMQTAGVGAAQVKQVYQWLNQTVNTLNNLQDNLYEYFANSRSWINQGYNIARTFFSGKKKHIEPTELEVDINYFLKQLTKTAIVALEDIEAAQTDPNPESLVAGLRRAETLLKEALKQNIQLKQSIENYIRQKSLNTMYINLYKKVFKTVPQ
jgi:hypothetical protein